MIVKVPATTAAIAAFEEITYRGISVSATVSFSLPQCVGVAEAVERGLQRPRTSGPLRFARNVYIEAQIREFMLPNPDKI